MFKRTTSMNPPVTSRAATALRFLRVGVGVLFLIFAEYKVFGAQFTLHGGYQGWIHRFIDGGGAYPFMVPVLQRVALPMGTIMAFAVAYGELAIGLALVFGVLTRAASLFGLLFMLALLFSSDYPGAHSVFWQYFGASLQHSVLAMCFIAFAMAAPSRRVA